MLGSFPGPRSLELQQYYAYPRSLFWPIMARICNFDTEVPYDSKVRKLLENGIAVWDVLKSCEREGAADTRIIEPVANNFAKFFRKYSSVTKVLFNGREAERLFGTHVIGHQSLREAERIYVPSSSPANARINFEAKLCIWKDALS